MDWRGGILIEGDDSGDDGAAGFDGNPKRDQDNEGLHSVLERDRYMLVR